jgi:hypothetical protein
MEESVIAKSTGEQEEEDMEPQDAALFRYLRTRKKISKEEANYREQKQHQQQQQQNSSNFNNVSIQACEKCKFNLPDESMCHIIEGKVDNKHGISKYFSPKGEGMLPGDIVWEFVKRMRTKLTYDEGHVINKGAESFQCKDCKYYMYYGNCLLIKGKFTPEMSCGFIVKIGNGTEV